LAPKAHLDCEAALISNNHVTTVFLRPTLFNVYLSQLPNCPYNSNGIDSSHLLELVNLFYGGKAESSRLNAHIVISLFDLRLLVKDDGVVILDAGVSLVCHLDLAICKEVNFVLYKHCVVMIGLIVEERCLDLSALAIDQFHVQQGAVAASVLPGLFVVLLGDPSLDLPIEEESVQALDRRVTRGEILQILNTSALAMLLSELLVKRLGEVSCI
jgi:hypothetical protein